MPWWAVQLILGSLCAAGVGIVIAVALVRLLGLSSTPPATIEPNPGGHFTTMRCIECPAITRRVMSGQGTARELGDVCIDCKRQLKKNVDHARAKLREMCQSNQVLDRVRKELHERGVTPA